jgi:hypothetical protein
MDRVTGRSRGFAFAEFSDSAMAADAIRRFAPTAFRATEFSRDFPPEVPDFPAFRKNGGSRRGLRAKKRSLR